MNTYPQAAPALIFLASLMLVDICFVVMCAEVSAAAILFRILKPPALLLEMEISPC